MQIKLEEEHLLWVIEGKRYSDHVIALFRDHYVNGVPKVQAASKFDFSQPFASKKFAQFETLLAEKCEAEGLQITTVLHKEGSKEKILKLDAIIRRFQKK